MNIESLMKWQWIMFLAPLALAILLALATAVGLGTGDSEAHAEGGHDHGLGAESAHALTDHETDSDSEGESSALALLGVGQAPLTVLLICLLVYWSVIGSLGNLTLGLGNIGFTVGLALVGAFLATGASARLIKRFLPTSQSFSVGRHELIGREGVAIYPITETSGTVRLHDKLGTLRQLDSRTVAKGEIIPRDTKVVVIDYDRERQVFTVQKWDDLVQTKEE
jgi:membrane protein implicated in regulation of membrane protease activity